MQADLPKVLAELSNSDPDSLLSDIENRVANLAGFEITLDDINIKRVEKEGYAARHLKSRTLVIFHRIRCRNY